MQERIIGTLGSETWTIGLVIAIILIGLVGLLTLVSIARSELTWQELPAKPHFWAYSFSAIAAVLWWIVSDYTSNPQEVIEDLGISNLSQLLPGGVSLFVGYVQGLALTQLLLATSTYLWIPVFVIYTAHERRDKKATLQAPSAGISAVGFILKSVTANPELVDHLEFEGDMWLVGDDRYINAHDLFISRRPNEENAITCTTVPPETPDSKQWAHLRYDSHANTLQGSGVTAQRREDGVINDAHSSQRPECLKEGETFWVDSLLKFRLMGLLMILVVSSTLIGSMLLMLTPQSVMAKGSAPLAPCFLETNATKVQMTPSLDGNSRWVLEGRLPINRENVPPSDALEWTIVTSTTSPIVVPEVTKEDPIFAKFLFDFDSNTVFGMSYAEFTRRSGYLTEEAEFWDKLAEVLVSSFQFNGEMKSSDVGQVSATWVCEDDQPPAILYASEKSSDWPGEFSTKNGMINRLRHLIGQCLVERTSATRILTDTSKLVYDQEMPGYMKGWIDQSTPHILLIVKWLDPAQPRNMGKYEVFQGNQVSGDVFVIDVRRDVATGIDNNVFTLHAPSFDRGATPEQEWVDLSQRLTEFANANRSGYLRFRTELPFVTDQEVFRSMRLGVTGQNCASQSFEVTLPELSTSPVEVRVPSSIRLAIFFSTGLLVAQVGLIVASLIRAASYSMNTDGHK